MAVITISRETGCGGSGIAARLAGRLGYHLADKETIGRILAEYGFVSFKETYGTEPSFWTRFDMQTGAVVSMVDKATLALAQHGNIVILGRGSFAVLAGYSDVINVRIKAPFRFRVMNHMEEHAIPEYETAEREVKESDRIRRGFVESFYNVKWDQISGFDLVADTGKIPPDLILDWIEEAAKSILPGSPKVGATTESINIDSAMSSTAANILGCQVSHTRN